VDRRDLSFGARLCRKNGRFPCPSGDASSRDERERRPAGKSRMEPERDSPGMTESATLIDLTFKAAPAEAPKVLNEIAKLEVDNFSRPHLYVHNEKDKGPARQRR